MHLKHLFVLVVTLTNAVSAAAQSTANSSQDGAILEPYIPIQRPSLHKTKALVAQWYNYVNSSAAGGINYLAVSNATLFPDSTVKHLYKRVDGTDSLGYASLHHVGQVFDPKSLYFEPFLTRFNDYTVDSIELGYKYMHLIPESVDTLEIQVYTVPSIRTGHLNDVGGIITPIAWIKYDRSTGTGKGSSQTLRYLLTEADTGFDSYQRLKIALNQEIHVPLGGLIAVSYRYIPGYSWTMGDTIQEDWNSPEPSKKLNHFVSWVLRDTTKSYLETLNLGLSFRNFQNSYPNHASWYDDLVPGNAWNAYTEQVYCSFHVASPKVNVNYPYTIPEAKVYPNPSNGSQELNFEYSLAHSSDVRIELFDIQGRKVESIVATWKEAGKYKTNVNLSNLQNGIYLYTITTGEHRQSGKVSLVN